MSEDLPRPLDVLAVGAHPDDVEIAVGGTLANLVRQGYQVGICDLTNGEPTPGSPGVQTRLDEAQEAARILGLQMRETLTLPNRCLFDSFAARIALARVIRHWRPKIVLGIAGKTPMASPDHWQAMQITDAAVFYSRLTKWDDEFAGLNVHTVTKQLWYPLGLSTLEQPELSGRFVVDISATLSTKLEAVRAYKTQFPPSKDRVFRLVESQNRFYGATAGFEAGELLISATPLGVRDLVATLCPTGTTPPSVNPNIGAP
ncbi:MULTISPECIES: PIG-L family deacetylase [unclassified Schlesneria]|uniref:PIG-L family deacetylase n=1 Tax=Schlesneria TaxID=656899 RepID=UPI002F0DF0BE